MLCVSQFTLFAKLQKHDRPDFHHAMGAAEARDLYSRLLAHMGGTYDPSKIKVGRGASWTHVHAMSMHHDQSLMMPSSRSSVKLHLLYASNGGGRPTDA